MHIRDIDKVSKDFMALAVSLENFLHRAVGQPEPHPKFREKSQDPQTLSSLLRQIREIFSRKKSHDRDGASTRTRTAANANDGQATDQRNAE